MSSTLVILMISAFIISVSIIPLSVKDVMLAKRIHFRTYLSGFILGLLCLTFCLFFETNRKDSWLILLSLTVLLFGIMAIAEFLKARQLHRKSKEEEEEEEEEEAEGGELR